MHWEKQLNFVTKKHSIRKQSRTFYKKLKEITKEYKPKKIQLRKMNKAMLYQGNVIYELY